MALVSACVSLDASDPAALGVERAARIFAAEHVERVLLRAGVAEDFQILVLALQQRHRGIEHDGGIDRALLHGGDRGGRKSDADDADGIRIDAVLAQQIFQEEVGRGAGRADADPLVLEVLHRIDLAGLLRRHHQRQAGIAVIDHEGFERLVLGGEIDAVVEIAGHDVGAAADHRGQRLRAALEIDQFDLDAGLFVFAELLGQHGRQVAQAARAADRDGDLRLRDGRARHQRQRAQCRQGVPDGFFDMSFSLDDLAHHKAGNRACLVRAFLLALD